MKKGYFYEINGVSAARGECLALAAELEIRHITSQHPKEAPVATRRECPRDRAHGGEYCHHDKDNGKRKRSEGGRLSRGRAEI